MAASSAEDVALQYATAAAIARPTRRPEPAASAAGPNAANTPAPIIEPSPMTTASPSPNRRASRLGVPPPGGRPSPSTANATSPGGGDHVHAAGWNSSTKLPDGSMAR